MGCALRIQLPNHGEPRPPIGSKFKVTVHYSTTKDCTALQWLDKE